MCPLVTKEAPIPNMMYKLNTSYEFSDISKNYAFFLGEILLKVAFGEKQDYFHSDSHTDSFSENMSILSLTVSSIDGKVKLTKDVTSTNEVVTIGSSKKNTICVDNPTISKHHCTLKFNTSLKNWVLVDGYKNKPSTNGTWLYLLKGINVNLNDDKNEFKLGKHTFELNKCRMI